MAKHRALLFYHAFIILILTLSLFCKATSEDRKVYIVYLGSLPDWVFSPSSHHLSILQRVVQESGSAENLLVRSYKRSFNGFAAKLTDQEREKLSNMKEVVSVFPSRPLQLQTTRSWDFMGFNEKVKRNAGVESDIIVGVIDSGIWPESDSFKDEGFGPPPKKWKGACEGGKNFTCNNKVIGARYYLTESARDEWGHGTHTASTAAGNAVKDVSFYGLAQGTARGGVPAARIAVYKVCSHEKLCSAHNTLGAFDDAIADGVDIITISVSFTAIRDFDEDPIAIGAFHAMEKGILTSNSAGNNGPSGATVSSVAAWMLTVAASSMDRRIIDKGNSVNTFALNGTSFPLIHGKDVSRNCTEKSAGSCEQGCLDSDLVKGKIVLCDRYTSGVSEAYKVGALGSILTNYINIDDASFVLPLPASTLNNTEYNEVMSYMNSTRDPQANILKSEVIKDLVAPVVASLSARGPNLILPNIIKPDISAPGVEILAAYSPNASISIPHDMRRVKYNIMTGTSMACPHATAVAAYVKTFHPDWSPAAIKSSIMTTAWPMNETNSNISSGEFAYGSGHINPVKAIDPGLVYEASKEDYVKLLCMKYEESMVRLISGDNSSCPTGSEKGSLVDLNYPSMGAKVAAVEPFTVKFHRTVKNVGLANSTYKAIMSPNAKVDIKVVPEVISFASLNEEKTFAVTVAGSGLPYESRVSASLAWSDGTHSVRSPIVVYTVPRIMSKET
ncbi:subtilisin-like protease SBT4.3 isoform X2 [Prunus avium]|uniref:Subtilisin-like protease SBT4.3 isoform X2 n=1 Tax=Prunus avium TaxID=42229 RepID=A0A6P5U2X8_PRUAV|nr:subtilisin-like protease SBT4.3 isoform X2 [Prunus avium]